jgi:predicted MFS family arabinose efflux permease
VALGGSFWRLFTSSGTSNLADGAAVIALPLLAASLTRDPVQIAALTAVTYLPWLLFAVPGGAIVDRVDRRVAMAVANTARAVAFGVLAVLVAADLATIWLTYVVAFAVGLAEVIYDSAARAILPQVVGKADLDHGNSYMTVADTVGNNFAGAPLGAFAFAAAAASPFLGASAAYVVAALMILTVAGSFRPERTQVTSLQADIGEGLRWLRHHSFLRGLTLSAGWFGLMQAMINGVMVLYALETLGLSERMFGLMVVGAAVGGLAGGLLAPRVASALGRGPALVAATIVSPMCLIAMGLTTSPWVATFFFGVSSGAVTTWNVLSMSIRQAMIPEGLFGRVLGAYRMVIWGVIPAGALAGGVLASETSLGTVFVAAGLGQLTAAAWIAALMRSHRSEIAAAYEPVTELS